MADKDNERWKTSDLGRRAYYLEPDGSFEGKRVEVLITVEGKTLARLQLREPGMVALVSKPDEEGIWLEVVSPGGIRYTDHQTPETVAEQQLPKWQADALGVRE